MWLCQTSISQAQLCAQRGAGLGWRKFISVAERAIGCLAEQVLRSRIAFQPGSRRIVDECGHAAASVMNEDNRSGTKQAMRNDRQSTRGIFYNSNRHHSGRPRSAGLYLSLRGCGACDRFLSQLSDTQGRNCDKKCKNDEHGDFRHAQGIRVRWPVSEMPDTTVAFTLM